MAPECAAQLQTDEVWAECERMLERLQRRMAVLRAASLGPPSAVIPVRTRSQQHAVDAAILRIAADLPAAPSPHTQPGAFFAAVADFIEAHTNPRAGEAPASIEEWAEGLLPGRHLCMHPAAINHLTIGSPMPITHCPVCSHAYEAGSEELANEPDRQCPSCRILCALEQAQRAMRHAASRVRRALANVGPGLNDLPDNDCQTILDAIQVARAATGAAT